MTRRLPAPRWQTPLPAGVVGSWGPDVAAWVADTLHIRLDRWQRRALNRALAYDARGLLVHRVYLTSTARQNGKTVKVRGLTGWALTAEATPDWRAILGLAHDKKQARIPYSAVLADLAPLARRIRGGLALTRYLGIRSDMYGRHREYHIGSREARDAIRGESTDLGLFDEVRTQKDFDTWAALEPTTTARPDPLIYLTSTAGDERSLLLRDLWERGRRIIDGAEPAEGFGMTWYAAPDDLQPDDPRAWRAANPALAEGRLSDAVIAASFRSLSPVTFRAERLNLWTDAADEWLPPGLWDDLAGAQPGDYGRVVLGVEAVPSWRRCTVTVALEHDVGVWFGVAAELDTSRMDVSTIAPEKLVAMVESAWAAWHPTMVVYSGAAAAAPHVEAWAKGRKVPYIGLTARQIRSASELFRSELIGRRLKHPADPLLRQQARGARPSGPLEAGDWYFSIRESLGEIDAFRAAVWAVWAAISPEIPPVPPQIFL